MEELQAKKPFFYQILDTAILMNAFLNDQCLLQRCKRQNEAIIQIFLTESFRFSVPEEWQVCNRSDIADESQELWFNVFMLFIFLMTSGVCLCLPEVKVMFDKHMSIACCAAACPLPFQYPFCR